MKQEKTPYDIVWALIDEIAARQNVSVSKLAKMCGLDPTTFNVSKRNLPNGNPHYPSLTTILVVLKMTNMSWHDFARLWDEIAKRKEDKNGRR